ncbi:MAG: glycoside hydrolase family 2 TIM barrel-domain containing protein [Bacteroidales bacterium]|nr:glycoside hydrolase family 2 TIM barrel-domain containing protein [Bacteroidales bacterium]
MTLRFYFLVFMISSLLSAALSAQETEVVYLSGTGFDRTAEWDFYCTDGMNSKAWTTIEVPSCWEQQGFGEYNYGHVPFEDRLKEEGRYRYFFEADRSWKGKRLDLVFEGVMTDARVLVNGKQAGEVHQGAFYRFSYDISRLVSYGRENKLEVFVKKFSDNESVNQAERKADYWVFGGIFRPVKLEIKAVSHLERVAIDASADGFFRSDIYLAGNPEGGRVQVEITDPEGAEAARFISSAAPGAGKIRISGNLDSALLWNPEDPHLYKARFSLLDTDGKLIHRMTESFGFRTVELRAEDGIYVNGERIKFKGVCRHSFHPDHGRTSSKAFSIEVVNLIKDMNMNAVRMSHYPPDEHFLDVCDSLGLFVLDELAGWQRPSYDSVVGRKLLGEMIARDVNHPSVVLWDNANEGGWNTAYDKDFRELDIQQRGVIHPWGYHDLTNTAHYVDYKYLAMDHFAPRQVFFPTEMIHGLYDGGLGAGLEDFWLRMWEHPLSAGGFLWVFADESLKRTDSGMLDSDGNHAPDGILGPYHEKEGSFYAVREIWSPVHVEKRYITEEFNGVFRIQNRFHFTNLDQCHFRYSWMRMQGPGNPGVKEQGSDEFAGVMDSGIPVADPLAPGQNGKLKVPLSEGWQNCDALYLEAFDPFGRLIHAWSWPVKTPVRTMEELLPPKKADSITVSESDATLILESGTVRLELSKTDGLLLQVNSGDWRIPLSKGPVFRSDMPPLRSFSHFAKEKAHHVRIDFGATGTLEWIMHAGGVVDMKLHYQPEGPRVPFTGASFSYPEQEVQSVTYLGNGPYRVWKNRKTGVEFNVWEKTPNNTIIGHSGFEYPEFRGYYSNLYWSRITDPRNRHFTIYSHTKDLYLRLFTPEEAPDPAKTTVTHPPGDLSFMLGIPAIGTKFKEAKDLGPQSDSYCYSKLRVMDGALHIELTFDFRHEE